MQRTGERMCCCWRSSGCVVITMRKRKASACERRTIICLLDCWLEAESCTEVFLNVLSSCRAWDPLRIDSDLIVVVARRQLPACSDRLLAEH